MGRLATAIDVDEDQLNLFADKIPEGTVCWVFEQADELRRFGNLEVRNRDR
jgi:hypothetical protein